MMFLGWYYDAALTQPAGDEDTVGRNMTLYARTGSLEGLSIQETPNYITVVDVETTFPLKLSGTDINTSDLTIIQVSANNTEIPFTVDSDGNVTVTGGWASGHTYKAVLKEESPTVFVHEGQPQPASIRIFNIIVEKAPVQNLSINDAEGGMKYIPRADVPAMSTSMEGLFTASLKAGNVGETTIDRVDQTGTFTYSGSEALNVGDIAAIYEGVHPRQRQTAEENEAAIVYVEITEVNGTEYAYRTADAEDVLFTPDVLPVSSDKLDGSNMLTLIKSEFFSNPELFSEMGLNADTTIDKGDFLAFYEGNLEDEDSVTSVTYGKIISVNVQEDNDTYIITYADATENEVLASMDIYTEENREIKLTEEQIQEIEEDILLQAQESGFVDEAAEYLAALALETDGFQELAGDFDLRSYTIMFADGTPVGEEDLSLMADSGRAKITKKEIQPTVHVGKLDHFENNHGIRVELNMELEITVDLGKDRSIVITLQAVFEQEVMLSVNTSGGAIWKKKWIFPYIADYRLNANLDMGTYTGIGITATARTKGKDDEKFDWGMTTGNTAGDKIIDIGKQIKELMDKKDKFLNHDLVGGKDDDDDDDDGGIPVSGGLEEKYAAMIEEADDSWIDIYRTEIFSSEGSVDPFHILCYGIKADFVVGANLYVTMGMTFTYEVAKRYNFSILLFERECTNDTIDLKAPEYEFTFYVMGTLGIRAGVEFEIGVGLFSLKLDSIGITAGAGVYAQLWGYFFYDLKGVENSDTGRFEKTSQYSGAMLIEIGAYLKITFKAQLFSSKKLTYQPTLYENQWPFYTIGERENVLGFAEKDDDGNEIQTEYDLTAVRTLALPSSLFSMRYIDLMTGEIGGDEDENETTKVTEMKAGKNWDDETESHYTIEMSDSHYTYNPANNTVTINPGTLSILPDCEMTIRWKSGTLAFSSEPIERRVIISWSDPANIRYIAFDSQGGSPVSQVSGSTNDPITMPQAPAKTGYDFGGWYTDSACTTPYTFPAALPEYFNGSNKGITIYAKWIPRNDTPYTVEHYRQELNGTYTLTDTDRLTGTTDSTAAVTAKISGEYAHFTLKTVPTARIAGNGTTVVRVYYNRKNYNISFTYGTPPGVDADAIPAARTYTAKYGATVYAPLLALRGYEMTGFSGVTNGEVVVTGPATYNAVWTAGQADYRVEHYLQKATSDGYALDSVEVKSGTSGEAASAGQKTFPGFTCNRTAPASSTINGDGSTVIRIYYNRNSYTLTLDTDGGTLPTGTMATSTLRYGVPLTLDAPAKTGYSFAGWWYTKDGAEVQLQAGDTMPAEDLTLTARWTAKSDTAYKVEHYRQDVSGDGYTLFETENKTGTTGASATATAKNYEHFTLNSSAAGAVSSGTIAADGSLVLKLYYDRETFTVTYNPNGGTLEGNETIRTFRYGAAFSAPDVTRTGYGLDGWFDEAGDKYDSAKTIIADVTVTARWTAGAVSYKVEHYLQDTAGAYPDAPSYTDTKSGAADAAVDLDALKRDDTGFAFDKSGQASYTIDWDGSTVVRLYYSRNRYTLTWDLGDGTAGGSYTQAGQVYYGVQIIKPTVTKIGHTPVWGEVPATMPDGDVIGTVIWTVNQREVTFNPNGGSGTTVTKTFTYGGSDNTAPTDFTRIGYNSKGWAMSATGTTTVDLTTLTDTDTEAITLYAVWTPEAYTITYELNGGTNAAANPAFYTIESEFTLADPTREGYTFLGWYTTPDFSGAAVTAITQGTTGEMTFYAKWEEIKTTVNYYILPDLWDNTSSVDSLLAKGQTLPTGLSAGEDLPNPTLKSGYFFYWANAEGEKLSAVPSDGSLTCDVYMVYAPTWISDMKGLKGIYYGCKDPAQDSLNGKVFYVEADITLDDTWEPIESFKGTLQGYESGRGNSKRKIIWSAEEGTDTIKPLFDKVEGTVSYLIVQINDDGFQMKANGFQDYNGAAAFGYIAVANSGTINNCSLNCEIIVANSPAGRDLIFGGLIGVNSGTIDSCSVDGGIIAADPANGRNLVFGGLVGVNENGGTILNSIAGNYVERKPLHLITTTGSKAEFGAIVGRNDGSIQYTKWLLTEIGSSEVYATIQAQRVAAGSAVGGIAGSCMGGEILFNNKDTGGLNPLTKANHNIRVRFGCSDQAYVGTIAGTGNKESKTVIITKRGNDLTLSTSVASYVKRTATKAVGDGEDIEIGETLHTYESTTMEIDGFSYYTHDRNADDESEICPDFPDLAAVVSEATSAAFVPETAPAVELALPADPEPAAAAPEADPASPAHEADPAAPASEADLVAPAPEEDPEAPAPKTDPAAPAPETDPAAAAPEADPAAPTSETETATPALEAEAEAEPDLAPDSGENGEQS